MIIWLILWSFCLLYHCVYFNVYWLTVYRCILAIVALLAILHFFVKFIGMFYHLMTCHSLPVRLSAHLFTHHSSLVSKLTKWQGQSPAVSCGQLIWDTLCLDLATVSQVSLVSWPTSGLACACVQCLTAGSTPQLLILIYSPVPPMAWFYIVE